MAIYKYNRFHIPGPNGTTYYFKNTPENSCTELGCLDDWYYVHVPEGVEVPEQPEQIQWQSVDWTPELREALKAVSPPVAMINRFIQKMIRDKYSPEDEQYFARIASSAAVGVYSFKPGEREALMAYNGHIEYVRQWGKEQKAKIGF